MKIIIEDNNIFKTQKLLNKAITILRLAKEEALFNIERLFKIDENRKLNELEYLNVKSDDIIDINKDDKENLLNNIIIDESYAGFDKIKKTAFLFFKLGSEYTLKFYKEIDSEKKLKTYYKELCESLIKIDKAKLLEEKLIYTINQKTLDYGVMITEKNISDFIEKKIWRVIRKVLSEEKEIEKLVLSKELKLFLRLYNSIESKSDKNKETKRQEKKENLVSIFEKLELEKNLSKIEEILLPKFYSRYYLKKDKVKLLIKYFQLKLLPKILTYNLNTDSHTIYMLFKELEEKREKGFESELYIFLFLNYLSSKQGDLTEEEKIEFKKLRKKYEDNQEKYEQYDPTKNYDLKKQYLFLSISEEIVESQDEIKKLVISYLKWLKQATEKVSSKYILSLFLTSNFKIMLIYKYLFLEKIKFIKEIRDKREINRTNAILRGEDIGVSELEKIFKNFDEVMKSREDIRSKYNLVENDKEYILNSFYISNLLYSKILRHFDKNKLLFSIYEKINIQNRVSDTYYIENKLVKNIDFYPLKNKEIEVDENYVFYKESIYGGKMILFAGKCLFKENDGTLIFKLIGSDWNYFERDKRNFTLKDIFVLEKSKIIGILKRIDYSF